MANNNEQTQPASQRMLGRYIIERRIGRGGMADVWLCNDPRLHRQVAIKTLPAHAQNDREYLMRFEREAQAAASLNHPHILPIHDYGEQSQEHLVVTYIVMPYISGGSLTERIAIYATQHQLMPVQEALMFLSQAAEAIDYAHQRGIIHRDIKPANMLLRQDNWLLLADFGIAHIVTENEPSLQTGRGFGTPEYMAPEQAQGKAVAASDIYSLAVLAYQLFTGSLPFMADTAYALTFQHMTMEPPLPQQRNPALPSHIAQALLQGLAKDPQKRFASARAFVSALQSTTNYAANQETYFPATPLLTTPTVGVGASSTQSKGDTIYTLEHKVQATRSGKGVTRRQLLAGGGVVLLAAGGLGAWIIESEQHTSNTPQKATPVTQATSTSANPYGATMTLLGHNKPARTVRWSPKANMLISSGCLDDGQVFLWDIDTAHNQDQASPTPKTKQQFPNTALGILAAWSPDGQHIALANAGSYGSNSGFQQSIFVFKSDLSSPEADFLKNPILVNTSSIDTLAWLDNQHIVGTTTSIDVSGAYFLHLWNWTQPQQQYTPAKIAGYLSYIIDRLEESSYPMLSVSPLGKVLAFATDDGILIGQPSIANNSVVWKQSSPLLKLSDYGVVDTGGIAWSPAAQTIAAFTNEGSNITRAVALFDATGQSQSTSPTILANPHATSDFTVIARSPSTANPLLAVATQGGTIYIWNMTNNAILAKTLQGPVSEVSALDFSADGQWLAASFADTQASILVWKM